ncbi:MAG TPA: LiaF-related protein, partial [Bryobacteraceae bacterium]|nr:LiaF-related protein [Bryobacteraceae bacterium]
EVQCEDSSFRGRLNISNKSRTTTMGANSKNLWEVKLAEDVRMDLNVTLGAGESNLDLGRLLLRSAKVQIGAGQVGLDLRGPKRSSCDVEIRGGVGEATVWVPNDVGVVAEAKGGIGEVSVRGLTREGDRWVNEKYNKAPVTIRLDVKGGIGQINIKAE